MRYFLLFSLIFVLSCIRKETPSERLEKFSEKGVVGVDFNNPATLRILGEPEKSETLEVDNPHYKEVKDYVITEYYRGCMLKKYMSPTFGKSIVFYFVAEDGGVRLNFVKFGDKADKIKKVFGIPVMESDSLLVYTTSAGSEINFYLKGGRLERVEWKLYID